MHEQIAFDLKKNWRATTNLVILIAFTLLLLITYFSARSTADQSDNDNYGAYVNADTKIQNELSKLQEIKNPDAATVKKLQKRMKQHEYLKAIVLAHTDLENVFTTNMTDARLNTEKAVLAYERYTLREVKAGRTKGLIVIALPGKKTDKTLLGRQKDVAYYEYLVKHKLVEVPATKKDAPANNYIAYAFLYNVSPLLLLAVFAVQLGQLFTIEKRRGTINFLNIVPSGKLRLLSARMVSFLVLTIPLFLVAGGIAYAAAAKSFEVGSWDYPIVYSADGRTVSIMNIGQFLVMFVLLLLAVAVFIMMVSALVSLYSGNLAVNIVASLAVILLGAPQVMAHVPDALARFLPTAYFQANSVILHETDWTIPGIGFGVVVLLAWSLVLYAVCTAILRRRELI
ncbi:ABC transporter permease [Lacticaseibacillus kribbianus]|uniref:ABC transporter permease n=1 Tax=Lacticaseibacillus kribbianus TaxID=2926292 RepID=UPI001CD28D3B|nr:ABC transporter permease [Lacticaseibacillus kribbianus]